MIENVPHLARRKLIIMCDRAEGLDLFWLPSVLNHKRIETALHASYDHITLSAAAFQTAVHSLCSVSAVRFC